MSKNQKHDLVGGYWKENNFVTIINYYIIHNIVDQHFCRQYLDKFGGWSWKVELKINLGNNEVLQLSYSKDNDVR